MLHAIREAVRVRRHPVTLGPPDGRGKSDCARLPGNDRGVGGEWVAGLRRDTAFQPCSDPHFVRSTAQFYFIHYESAVIG